MEFNIFDMPTCPQKIGLFYLSMQQKSFTEINRVGMLWTVHHLWPSGARFVFNCYRHWSSLVLRNRNRTASTLYSSERVMQGYPISMVACGIGVLPMIKNLKAAHPDATKTWYADGAGGLVSFGNI